jgi:hypothetical protein
VLAHLLTAGGDRRPIEIDHVVHGQECTQHQSVTTSAGPKLDG